VCILSDNLFKSKPFDCKNFYAFLSVLIVCLTWCYFPLLYWAGRNFLLVKCPINFFFLEHLCLFAQLDFLLYRWFVSFAHQKLLYFSEAQNLIFLNWIYRLMPYREFILYFSQVFVIVRFISLMIFLCFVSNWCKMFLLINCRVRDPLIGFKNFHNLISIHLMFPRGLLSNGQYKLL
jgi:hypothetical protein